MEFVSFEIRPSAVDIQTIHASMLAHGSICRDAVSHRQFIRSGIRFLDMLKQTESLAIKLRERDLQRVEQCKSMQRRYISSCRQRQNGKFKAETAKLPKIRAPLSLKVQGEMIGEQETYSSECITGDGAPLSLKVQGEMIGEQETYSSECITGDQATTVSN
jgi:hypothetical protein